MKPYKKRDENEPAIVKALEAIGASVSRIDNFGVPDLLVGYRGRTILLEVKNPSKTSKAHTKKSKGVPENATGQLTDTQIKWWQGWNGGAAYVVTSVEEAIAVVRGVELPNGVEIIATVRGVEVIDLADRVVTADQAETLAGALHEQAAVSRARSREASGTAEEWSLKHG